MQEHWRMSPLTALFLGLFGVIGVGIAPETEDPFILLEVGDGKGSRPDAWIWTPDGAVCIETKVVGMLDPVQLARHAKTLGTGVCTSAR